LRVAYITYTKYKRLCPHCGWNFETVYDPTALRLGPGSRFCMRCGKIILDGSIEWPELTPAQKRKFLYGDLPLFGLLGAVCSAFFMFFAVKSGDPELGIVGLGVLFAFAVVILGIFYLICWLDIVSSKRRYEAASSLTLLCAACGYRNDSSASFCRSCGKRLTKQS
jgi:hypothetical protein